MWNSSWPGSSTSAELFHAGAASSRRCGCGPGEWSRPPPPPPLLPLITPVAPLLDPSAWLYPKALQETVQVMVQVMEQPGG